MQPDDEGSSHPVGTILILAITFVLAALVILLFHMPPLRWEYAATPAIFKITTIVHTDEINGKLNYDSRMIILHAGTATYDNTNLKANLLKNGVALPCVIETMNGHDFISTVHLGVQWMGGAGCSGSTWTPGEMTAIDITDGTFHPGDTVQLDIIEKPANQVISRHVYKIP
jgi:flagellin-like protein